MRGTPAIFVILGPTASGKTALALDVAQQIGAEILSVDSMQIYRHMNIGTAKPTMEERRGIVHHLIDVINPDETFAVSQFVRDADAVIESAKSRNVPLIATGGTPMYYKALFEGLFEGPGMDEALRLQLNERPLDELYKRLAEVDPEAATRIHANDRRRIVRALEVFEITDQPISSLQKQWTNAMERHKATWFGLNWEKETLNRRINARVKQMMQAGWLDETRGLLENFGQLSQTASGATGYHELIEHVHGRMSLEDAVEQIKIATRQLARRQMKWFRRWNQVQWLDGASEPGTLLETVLQSMRSRDCK